MTTKPRVIVDPAFRRVSEIFDAASLDGLHEIADVVWGRDEPMPEAMFLDEIAVADAVVFGDWRHGPAAIANAGPRLRALLEVAGGHEHEGLDYAACLERGIRVGSCAPAFGPAVAEMALSLALSSMRGVAAGDRGIRAGTERWLHEGNRGNTTMLGATVGFVGCGGISRQLQLLLEPFRVDILGYDPPMSEAALKARGIAPADLPTVFEEADAIFVLAAPTAHNAGLVSRALLERLCAPQTLIVISRAHLVDFDAMVELAADGRFRIAVDVYPEEPLPPDHPIRDIESAVCVPHLAGALPAALLEIGRMVVADIRSIFHQDKPPDRMQYLTSQNAAGLLQTAVVPPGSG